MRGLTTAERFVALATATTLLLGLVSAASVASPPEPAPRAKAPLVASPVVPPPSPLTRFRAPKPPPRVRRAPKPAVALAPAPPQSGCPPRPAPPSGPRRPPLPPVVAEGALPTPLPVLRKAARLDVVRGKGLWATPFGGSPLDIRGLLASARRSRVDSIWVRTGGTRQGYYGGQFLSRLIPAAHRAGLAVIAWDFPTLSDPVADSRRAQAALAAGVDGFSPDVETRAEGSFPTAARVALYLSLVRRSAGARPVIATVPRPSAFRRTFPYRAFVPYADVFAPMVYWSCKEPGDLAQQAIRSLGALLPVVTVGQGYDMGPEGGRRGTPSREETLRFLDASRRGGAIGASLWTVEEAGRDQLAALAAFLWR